MTAPRAREQRRPPSPPDRRPPRRGGDSSPSTYAASAAGRAAGPARLAPRGLVRCARALAAAALLALTGALFLPPTAEAQTATTLISNTGQGDTATHNYGGTFSQRFTTGSNEDGYTLTGVDVVSASSTGFTAQVCGVDSDLEPTSTCTGLTAPGTFAVGTMSFTAPTNTTLVKETTYAVVVTALATNTPGPDDLWSGVAQGWELTFSNRVDANPAAGWSIASTGDWKERDPPGSWRTHVAELRIAIKGSAAGGGTPTCTLNTGDLWCGVVTVGAITTGGSVAAHGFAGTDGGLDDKTFSVGTNNYTIDGLYVGTAGDLNLDLTGALDAADKGNLKLVVGSTDFDLDDATHVSSENAYLWTGTGLDWSSDTHVTLRMRRAVALSTDATLSGLTVYDGSSNLTLSPSFASGTEAYTASAAYDIATVTVTATKNQADATIAWLDASDATLADADAMASGHQVALEAGANTFKVKVTAEDGTTTKTYTVTVNRASPTCTLNTGDLWCGVITVGHGTGFDGYVPTSSLGALSDRTFSVGTNNYTIAAIFVQTGGFDPGRLTFNLTSGLTSADQAALVLHLGSTEFEFSDASVVGGKSYSWQDAGLNWSSESFVTLRLRDTPVANNAPVFSPTTATREVEENSAAGTNVGAVIPEATDSDSGDTLTYSMEGTDADSFAFDASTRQITTITGVTYNHEATKNSYSVTVKASDGTASATIAVTIDVTDVNEKSAKPDKPTLAKVTGSSTTLTATWTKPDLNGGPDIATYIVQYREGTTGVWTTEYNGNALTTTITGLTADTSYQVQVRAKNGETDSDWSDPSDAVKTNAEMTTGCTLNTGDLWCGVATVEELVFEGTSFAYGFVDASASPNPSDTGALSDKEFTVGTNRYTIDIATVGLGATAEGLNFSLTSALSDTDKEKLVLHVGSRTFAFSDATRTNDGFTYQWSNTGLDWSSESTVTLRLRTNTAPVFAATSATREVAENSAVGTSVGAVVTATDADNDTLTYSLEGTDAASFEIDSGTGQIKTKSGVTYNFEATKNSYSVTVKASDGTASATIAVTIDVTDVNEKSAKPAKPVLAMVTGSSTSLTATWTKPDLNGGPDIAGYDLQYRVGTTGTWEDFAHSDTAVTTTVTGLTADTSYQVQVRAKNGETDSDWSDPSDAVKTHAAGVTCTDNDIDLVRGMDRSEGSVQICHDNEQRSVCDDSFDQSPATEVANGWAFAGVVCRQLGYATGAATAGSHFGDIFPARYWLDEVVCDGSEANLGACTHAGWGVQNCSFSERAGVQCTVAATGLTATGGDGEVDLAWDAPGADPGITRHEYRYKTTGGAYPAAWTPVPDSAAGEANEASHTVTGLAAGTGYDFELRIVGGSNESGADAATARTTGVAAPTNFMAMAGDAQVMLSWDAPETGSGVTKHQYRQKTTGSYGNWTDIPNSAEDGANDAGFTVTTNIVNDTAYTFELRAVKDGTNSDPAEAGPVTPTAVTPGTCTLNPGDIWCGVVTVGGGSNYFGYESQGTPVVGGLSDVDFDFGTNSYTIVAINVGSQTAIHPGALGLTFSSSTRPTAAVREKLVLHVGSAAYRLSQAFFQAGRAFNWRDAGLDWSSATTVTLRLREHEDPAADATLSALSVTHPRGTVPLRPAFAPGTGEYRASVANPVDEVTVAAEANVADATLAYLDGDGAAIPDADTNTPGREVALEVGEETVVEVKVTAEDGTAMRTYRVTVTRRAVDAPGEEGKFRLAPETVVDYDDPDNDRYGEEAGRVEVYHAGAWGTVCSDGIRHSSFSTFDHDPATGALIMDPDGNPAETEYDNEAAALICKAMDYDDGEYAPGFGQSGVENPPYGPQMTYYPVGSSYPADGPKPIWLDDLTCVAGSGFVPSTDPLQGAMSHCSYAGWGLHNCTHKEDAGVRCWNNDAAGPGLKSLKGRFVSPPERHDGTNRVKVRVAFSEPVEESPENVGAHGVEVEGGEVTSVSPVGGDARDGAGTRSAGGRNAGGEDREVVWEFEIEPDSDGDLTVTLEAGRPCGEPGAICTADGRALSEGISTTVEGPEPPPPLTASFGNMPEAHDGAGAFRFRVAFSENIGISYRSLREDAFAVSGGRVTRGRRVDDRRDLFEMTVEPDGDGEVTVTLPAGRECSVSGAICTKGENRRQLTNAPTATVAGPAVETGPAGLTARFARVPSEHDGKTAFKLRIAFSEEIRMSGRRLRSDVVAVSGGRATKAGRVNRPKDLWKLKVRPDSLADVTVTLSSGAACDSPGAVCTADGRALSNTISATVEGPVAVSVADARAREGEDETIDFAVSLSRAASGRVSVTYATADGTATAGSDYTRASGKLRFAPGETEKRVRVPVLDDVVDEGEETFTLRLLNASGAVVADGEATGTIVNSDPLQKMWLSRFGRTVAGQVVDAVTGRLSGSSGGSQVTLGGQSIDLSAQSAGTGEARRTLAGARPPSHLIECGQNPRISPRRFCVRSPGAARAANDDDPPAGSGSWEAARAGSWADPEAGHGSARAGSWEDPEAGHGSARSGSWADLEAGHGSARSGSWADLEAGHGSARSGSWEDPETDHGLARTLTGRELLLGSSFHLTTSGGEAGGPGYAAWGRMSVDGFDGEAPADGGTMRLDGEVTTGLLGADAQWERWLAGVALSVSSAEGTFDQPGVDSGTVESTLTSVNPYVRYEASDRLSVWGLVGYGTGDMTIRGNSPVRTDLMMRLGAAGARGVLLEAGEDGGIDLALRGDAFLVQMDWEKVSNETDTRANASRLRLVLEAGRSFTLGEGAVLVPALELGLRHDGGDAETGTGVEVGGRIRYTDAGSGLTVEANARTLVAHEDSGYREWGAGGSVRLGPDASGRGLSLALAPVWGTPSSGVDRLWSARDAAGLAPGEDFEAERRLEGEVGYGFGAFGGHGLVTPYAGLGLAAAGDRTWRAGARWSLAPHLAMSLDGTRREPANDNAPEHAGQFRLILRW